MKNKFRSLLVVLVICTIISTMAVAFAAGFGGPVLITSVGQSADGQVVQVLARRAGVEVSYDSTVSPDAVGNYKTVIMVIGGSSKGLGAAGINQQQEEARAQAIINAANNSGTSIIAMHVGGSERRGDLTDNFIRIVNPAANMSIVVGDANGDGIFNNSGNLTVVDDMAGATAALKSAFQ